MTTLPGGNNMYKKYFLWCVTCQKTLGPLLQNISRFFIFICLYVWAGSQLGSNVDSYCRWLLQHFCVHLNVFGIIILLKEPLWLREEKKWYKKHIYKAVPLDQWSTAILYSGYMVLYALGIFYAWYMCVYVCMVIKWNFCLIWPLLIVGCF